MTQAETINTLATMLPTLSGWAASFAESVLEQSRRGRVLSDKQMFHVNKIVAQAAAPRQQAAVGDLTGIVALFDKARRNLKYPAVVLQVADNRDGISTIRISVAGERSSQPGSLNVTSVDKPYISRAGFPERAWYGRVATNGTYSASAKVAGAFDAITGKLAAFAADPAGVAAEYGRLTGNCCFCAKALTDERSTAVGYGAKCAQNYGLPWGVKAAAEASKEDEDRRDYAEDVMEDSAEWRCMELDVL